MKEESQWPRHCHPPRSAWNNSSRRFDHLSPAQRVEFERRLAARRAENGSEGPDEATLVLRCQSPAAGGD